MAKVIFVTDELSHRFFYVDDSTATGSSADNLNHFSPKVHWQTPDLVAMGFKAFASGQSEDIDTFALLYTNATSNAQWRLRFWVQAGDDNNPTVDTGFIAMSTDPGQASWPYVHAIYRHPSLIETSFCRIDITDPTNPDGFFRAGRFMVSRAFEPERNFGRVGGFGFGAIDPSEVVRALSGAVKVVNRPTFQAAQFVMEEQTPADAHTFGEFARVYGSRQPVLVAMDYLGEWIQFPQDSMIYSSMQFGTPPVSNGAGHQRFRVPIGVSEYA